LVDFKRKKREDKTMKELRVKVTLLEEMLGMEPADKEIHGTYISSKSPDAKSKEEEIESLGVEEVILKGRTVFPKMDDGTPFMWDYQIKGMMKDVCSMLRRVKGSKSSKFTAYKKEIDGTMFPGPRKIPITVNGEMGNCQRPLRANTAQGERVALADSETVPEGSTFEFTIKLLNDEHEEYIKEWLDYLQFRGFGQWRNSGKGRALAEII
jgi:hypothetical protein